MIQIPRNRFRRKVIQIIGRILISLLARVERSGFENFPSKGPYIIAGNHVAVMEVALMAIFAPGPVEFLGTGDIPIDPSFAWLARLWGFIPIRRGNLDRDGLTRARDVLWQGGVLAVFPEGGIWDPAEMDVRIGVAWLSRESKAPVIPVGFGGMCGALSAMMRLKRPKLFMNIGQPIPAVGKNQTADSRQQLEKAAAGILDAIRKLIPDSEIAERPARYEEQYVLNIYTQDERGLRPLDVVWNEEEQQAFARFLFNPILLDALNRNLKLPVSVMKTLNEPVEPEKFLTAIKTLLDYLEVNPGFFTYRFGMTAGIAVKTGLQKLLAAIDGLSPQEKLLFDGFHSYRERPDGEVRIHRLGLEIAEFHLDYHQVREEESTS